HLIFVQQRLVVADHRVPDGLLRAHSELFGYVIEARGDQRVQTLEQLISPFLEYLVERRIIEVGPPLCERCIDFVERFALVEKFLGFDRGLDGSKIAGKTLALGPEASACVQQGLSDITAYAIELVDDGLGGCSHAKDIVVPGGIRGHKFFECMNLPVDIAYGCLVYRLSE